MKNYNLSRAKFEKNDEFYTMLGDIEKEIPHYKNHFKGKVVFCNCDDPAFSNFYKYFSTNFKALELKKLITTHYSKKGSSYALIVQKEGCSRIELKDNGDFRSKESIALLKEADIVVTNPPFSLFREYLAQLMEYNKSFLILGPFNVVTTNSVFEYIEAGKLRFGYNNGSKRFIVGSDIQRGNLVQDVSGDKIASFGNIAWYTNLKYDKQNGRLQTDAVYLPGKYEKFDECDAINVDRIQDIPMDYKGIMGVPITFLEKYNPEQFEIIQLDRWGELGCLNNLINGKHKYRRVYIRFKD